MNSGSLCFLFQFVIICRYVKLKLDISAGKRSIFFQNILEKTAVVSILTRKIFREINLHCHEIIYFVYNRPAGFRQCIHFFFGEVHSTKPIAGNQIQYDKNTQHSHSRANQGFFPFKFLFYFHFLTPNIWMVRNRKNPMTDPK